MKNTAILVLALAIVLFAKPSHKPKEGFVPNEATAVKIAEAIWFPIYGEEIFAAKPFKAVLKDGIWFVNGTLPDGWLGGVPEAEISKKDGKILRVSHGE
jgi:hypothetical protein